MCQSEKLRTLYSEPDLVRLNNQLLLIPDAEDDDKFDDTRLKSIYFSAMPTHWKREFR